MSLNVGDKLQNLNLWILRLKLRTLDEFKGKKLVLSFFVAASSPVCETELCTFRDSWHDLADLGAQVIAISNDGPFANKAFAEKHNFNFPLLGDYNSKTIQDYDVLMKDLLHVKDYNAAKRSVFIIMEDGKIGYKWVSEDPLKEPNYEEIKNFLKGKLFYSISAITSPFATVAPSFILIDFYCTIFVCFNSNLHLH